MSETRVRLVSTADYCDGPAPAGEVVEVWHLVAPVLAVWDERAQVFRTVDDRRPLSGSTWWRKRR